MVTVAYFNVGPLQNGRPPACFPESCPSLVIFAILGLAGFFVTLWGGGETIAGFLIHEDLVEYHTGPLPTPQPGSGPEDESILSIGRELQRAVKRPKFGEITSLAWSEYQQWYSIGWKRKNIRNPFTLLLPEDLRGRLALAEWKILLTYYFLHLKPRLRIVLRYFWSVIGGFMLIPVGGILANLEYGLQGGRFYGQFIAGPAVLVLLIFILPLGKKLALRWDRWVAEEIGRSALLDLFKKIDSFQLPRVENAKKRHGWVAGLWPMPNMTERIHNLTDR
jgi:hypothetical protein